MNINKFIFPVLIVVLVGVMGSALYFYQKTSALKADPNSVAQKETVDLVAKVGKLILLPEGETPTIATVSDPSKLASQPFFAKAKIGDQVLLYQNARIAYLYDPTNNKILEVAPINLGDNTTIKTPASKTTTTTTIKNN